MAVSTVSILTPTYPYLPLVNSCHPGCSSLLLGCTYDSRLNNTIVVADRANSRFEFFTYDPTDPSVFDYSHTVDMVTKRSADPAHNT